MKKFKISMNVSELYMEALGELAFRQDSPMERQAAYENGMNAFKAMTPEDLLRLETELESAMVNKALRILYERVEENITRRRKV
jgi:hypothetical protein